MNLMKRICQKYVPLLAFCLALTGCDQGELKREKQTDQTDSVNQLLIPSYSFKRNGISSVDITAAVRPIDNLRILNNGLNPEKKLKYEVKREVLEELKPFIARSLKDSAQIMAHLNTLVEQFHTVAQEKLVEAAVGKAGIVKVTNESGFLVDAKGVELGQVLQKMLMGAMQINNIYCYLDTAVSEQTTERFLPATNYSVREHAWDTAYGFLGRTDIATNPRRITSLFLANYIEKEVVGMASLQGIDIRIYQNFYAGRKALSNNDLLTARQKAQAIKLDIDKLLIERTLFYLVEARKILQKSPTLISENYYHNIGEALGFILCLPFTSSRMLSYSDAIVLYNKLIGTNELGVRDKDRLLSLTDSASIRAIIETLDTIKR